MVTFLATADGIAAPLNATGFPGGSLVPCYTGRHRSYLECHRLARSIVTFLATGDGVAAPQNATGLPGQWCRFLATSDSIEATLNATGLPGEWLRSLLQELRT